MLNLRRNNISEIDWRNLSPALTELDLELNNLSSVGDITQCRELKVWNLNRNKIGEVDWRNLPPTLTRLHLHKNQLSTVGDMCHWKVLKVLHLSSNKISAMDGRNLPPTLTKLDLYDNQLSAIGDISHCTELLQLYLRGNPNFQSIHGLPNRNIYLMSGSNVKVLGQRCFHKHTYNMLKDMCKFLEWNLDQPPVEVLLQGLESVLDYFKDNLVRITQTR